MNDDIHRLLSLHFFDEALNLQNNFEMRNKLRNDIINYLNYNKSQNNITVISRVDLNSINVWEGDFIKYIFETFPLKYVYDPDGHLYLNNSIIIDNLINNDDYYKLMREKYNYRFGIFHISDENYKTNRTCYQYANFIIRNYPLFDNNNKITNVPLGYKSGFTLNQHEFSNNKNFTWSFAGDINKQDRKKMLEYFKKIAGGHFYVTNGFFDPNALSVHEYSQLLRQSYFIPCPFGNTNIDSFRIYEAFEAGSIPILINRYSKEYFKKIFKRDFPTPFFHDWEEAVNYCNLKLRNKYELEQLLFKCKSFWNLEITELKIKISSLISDNFL